MENRLYVGNLSDDVSASALKSLFAGLGEVSEVHLATDRGSGRSSSMRYLPATICPARTARPGTSRGPLPASSNPLYFATIGRAAVQRPCRREFLAFP